MIRVLIEGPPGSGKTQLMELLEAVLVLTNKKFICVEEVQDTNDFLIGDTSQLDVIIMTKQRVFK